jgi:tetratricopeptide (TPR) repeat protein
VLALVSVDLEDDPVHLGQDGCQMAVLLLRAGRTQEAEGECALGVQRIESFFSAEGGTLKNGGHGVPRPGQPGRPDLGASFYAVLAEAYLTRAETLRALGREQEAASWSQLARDADPDVAVSSPIARAGPTQLTNPPASAGDRQMAAGRFRDAAAWFREEMQAMGPGADPVRRLELSLRLAEALHRSGDPQQALEVVEQALDGAPRLPDRDAAAAHYGEALIYRDLAQPELMRFHMRECLRLDPAHPRAAWMREMLAQDPVAPKK